MRSTLNLLFFIALFLMAGRAMAQDSYKAITPQGNVLTAFQALLDRKPSDIQQNEGADNTALPLYERTDIQIKRLIKSGMMLYNDTLSRYVNQVGSKLVPYTLSLKQQPRFFVLRNTVPNAFSFADGSIMVTTGLLARLSSESQLAFVLAHEISHYEKRHALKEFQQEAQLQEEFKTDMNDENTFIRVMHYSKENELDADAAGLEILIRSGYNAFEAVKALRSLNPADSAHLKTANLEKIFKSDIFNFDSISRSSIQASENHIVVVVRQLSKEDNDKLETHPALDKRMIAIEELLKNTDYKNAHAPDSAVYHPIKNMAMFQLTEDALLSGSYGESLYLCLDLLEKYPANTYLHYTIARDLFWLSVYKDRGKLHEALSRISGNYGSKYDEFEEFFSKLTTNDFKKLCYSYIRTHYQAGEKTEDISFYMSFLSEYYLGKGVARFYYNNYLKDFPFGKYADIVKTKLGS